MKVQLESELAKPEIVAHIGDIIELPDAEAFALIKGRFAMPVSESARLTGPKGSLPRFAVSDVFDRDDAWTDENALSELLERDAQMKRHRRPEPA